MRGSRVAPALLVAAAVVGCVPAGRVEPVPVRSRPAGADARAKAPAATPVRVQPGFEPAPGRHDDPPAAPRVTIAAAGDLVLSERVNQAARAMGPDGLARMLEGYRGLIRDDDIATINLETPLVDDEVPLSTGWPPVLGAPPGVAAVLARAGVDFLSVATNHAYDQGHCGLARTLVLLDEAGLAHAGAGPAPDDAFGAAVVARGPIRVALLSFTGTMNQPSPRRGGCNTNVARLWDERRAIDAVAAARVSADVVVAALHWSRDFAPAVTPAQRRLARRLVEAGADVVLGTGTHTLQEVERLESSRGEAVVAYSLGNLLSSMAFRYRPGLPSPAGYVHPSNVLAAARDGVVLRVTLELDAAPPAPDRRLRIVSLVASPLWTTNTCLSSDREGAPLEIRVGPLAQAPAEIERERRPLVAAALGEQVELLP